MAATTAGRIPKYREKLSERIVVYVTPTQLEHLKERAPGGDVSSFARERVTSTETPSGSEPEGALAGTDQFRGPLLSPVACGPWREALEQAESFCLSHQTAEFLEVREGDLFLPAQGQSMEGAGIQDGFLIVVRPLDGKIPRRHDIVLVEVLTEDGEAIYTLKHWGQPAGPGSPPQLTDGQGNDFALPLQAQRIQPIGRAVALLGRL